MKTNGNDKALEAYKIFPFVAWVLVIGFAYFVYNIAVELQAVATDLKIQTEYIQQQVNTPTEKIQDFENKVQ